MTPEQVRKIAETIGGWVEVDHQEKNGLIVFEKGGNRISVVYDCVTVGTKLNHQRYGTRELIRENIKPEVLVSIFQNPRVHTGKGYFKR